LQPHFICMFCFCCCCFGFVCFLFVLFFVVVCVLLLTCVCDFIELIYFCCLLFVRGVGVEWVRFIITLPFIIAVVLCVCVFAFVLMLFAFVFCFVSVLVCCVCCLGIGRSMIKVYNYSPFYNCSCFCYLWFVVVYKAERGLYLQPLFIVTCFLFFVLGAWVLNEWGL